MKTEFVVRYDVNALRFDEKLFFSTVLGVPPNWGYKSYNEYVDENILNLSTIDKIQLKCDVVVGSVVNGSRQPILYSFVSDKTAGYKVFVNLNKFII